MARRRQPVLRRARGFEDPPVFPGDALLPTGRPRGRDLLRRLSGTAGPSILSQNVGPVEPMYGQGTPETTIETPLPAPEQGPGFPLMERAGRVLNALPAIRQTRDVLGLAGQFINAGMEQSPLGGAVRRIEAQRELEANPELRGQEIPGLRQAMTFGVMGASGNLPGGRAPKRIPRAQELMAEAEAKGELTQSRESGLWQMGPYTAKDKAGVFKAAGGLKRKTLAEQSVEDARDLANLNASRAKAGMPPLESPPWRTAPQPDIAPGTSFNPDMFGGPSQGQMFTETGAGQGFGQKQKLIDVEAEQARVANKPVEGQAGLPEAATPSPEVNPLVGGNTDAGRPVKVTRANGRSRQGRVNSSRELPNGDKVYEVDLGPHPRGGRDTETVKQANVRFLDEQPSAVAPETPQPTNEIPAVAPEAAARPVETPKAAPKSKPASILPAKPATPTLPRDLAGAKPRYGYGNKQFTLGFASDLDRALYIVAQANPSRRDADYMRFLRGLFPHLEEADLRAAGREIRATIKPRAKRSEPGALTIGDSGQLQKLQPRPGATPAPQMAGETPAQPSQAVSPAVLSAQPATPVQHPPTAPPVSAPPRTPRQPLWQNPPEAAANATAPQSRLLGGAIPPTQPPAGGGPSLPSGRTPGGPGRMGPQPPRNPLGMLEEALSEPKKSRGQAIEEGWRSFVRAMSDRNADLKLLERQTGIPTHKLAQITGGDYAAGEDLLRRELMPVLNRFDEAGVKQLEQYMSLRRMEDVLAKYGQSTRLPGGIDGWAGQRKALAQLQAKLGPQRMAEMEDAAKELYRLNDELVLKPKLEAELISPEAYRAIKADHPHYIDFHRLEYAVPPGASRPRGGRQVASIGDAGIDRMADTGSDLHLDQPLARFAAQVIDTQVKIGRQRAARGMVGALLEMEKITGQELVKFGETATMRDAAPMRFFMKGEETVAQVPKVYADIAKGLEAEPANALSNILRALGGPLRAGAVTYNPAFLVVNPLRDAISAWFREGLVPMSPDYIRGWVAAITKNADFADAAEARVLGSGIVESFRSTKALASATRQINGIQVKSVKDALLVLPRLIEAANVAGERATRIATFKKLQGQGVNRLEAAVRSRDVTVDFAKSGNVIRLINQAVPFLNAGIQGATNTVKVMRYNPKQALVAAAPLGTASVMFYLWNQRYETANLIPDYEYSNNWVLQIGEGTKAPDPKNPGAEPEAFPVYIKIPKGPAGALLTAPVEALLRIAWAKDDRSVAEHFLAAGTTAVQSLSPVEPSVSGILPPLLSTGAALESGVDPFQRKPIVPAREENRPPEQQFGPETSKAAVALGQQFKVSPRLVEFAVRDYTAGTGQLGMWMVDLGLGALGYNPQVPGEAKQQALSPAEEAAKTPVLSRFLGARGTAAERAAWDDYREAVEDTQRGFSEIPDVVRLGINLGEVGDNINNVPLTPKERANYQRIALQKMTPLVANVTTGASYQRASDKLKEAMIRKAMDNGRAQARAEVLKGIGAKEAQKRLAAQRPAPSSPTTTTPILPSRTTALPSRSTGTLRAPASRSSRPRGRQLLQRLAAR